MDFVNMLKISASGIEVQRKRMEIISSNLANAETTRTDNGGPYRRKMVVMGTQTMNQSFEAVLDKTQSEGVKIEGVVEDQKPFRKEYNPSHPDADSSGYLLKPNVDMIVESINMMMASRAFEANLAAIKTTREMVIKSLEIGR